MATSNLRSALSRMIHSENDAMLSRKLGAPAVAGLKSRPVRGAMQEIGNNMGLLGRDNKGGKADTVKPSRDLTKQKGVVFLKVEAPKLPPHKGHAQEGVV